MEKISLLNNEQTERIIAGDKKTIDSQNENTLRPISWENYIGQDKIKKNLQVFILSKQAIHANSYRDFPITLSQNLVNLVDTNNKLDLFLDSLKRTLNIEIRDYQAPLFILQDTHNNIIQSIEGAVLEEIFEQMITDLLTQDNKIDSNKLDSNTTEKTPNNTLSQSAPSSTESLQSK